VKNHTISNLSNNLASQHWNARETNSFQTYI
jgi:hypothetical protein